MKTRRPLAYFRRPRPRYQALYVALPFDLAESLPDLPRIVVPNPPDAKAAQPDVHLRFHATHHGPAVLDLRAVRVASARAGQWRTLREPEPLRSLRARAANAARPRVSVVELETAIPHSSEPFTVDHARALAEQSLVALNRFLDIYQVLTEQVEVHHLNLENLGPELVLELRRRTDKPSGQFRLPHKSKPLPGEYDAATEHLLPLLEDAMRRERHQHPLDLVRRLYLRACRFADTGEYEAAIIFLQASVERLVYALHNLVRVDQGHPSTAIEKSAPSSFSSALRQLPHLLGGDWSLDADGPIATYWRDLYLVRNRTAHAGVTPSRDKVPDAFDAYGALWEFVLDRVAANRHRYPRTALAVHGGRGLAERGKFDDHMAAAVQGFRDDGEEDWFWLPNDKRTDLKSAPRHG